MNLPAIPYPGSPVSRALSAMLAVLLSFLILVYPAIVAASVEDIRHGMLSLLMYGISVGFVHGTGFVPRSPVWRLTFHPILGWSLMLLALFSFAVS